MESNRHPLICPICKQVYTLATNPPICLVCQHRVCFACANNIIKPTRERLCPMCRCQQSIVGDKLQVDTEYVQYSQMVLQGGTLPCRGWRAGPRRGNMRPRTVQVFPQAMQFTPSIIPCRYVQNNEECPYGAKCRFTHSQSINRIPCTFFIAGKCKRGNQCAFYHDQNTN